MSGYCWCGGRFYSWIGYRLEPSYKVLLALKRRNPDMIYFQTYEEATKWIHDLVSHLDISSPSFNKIDPIVSEVWFIRCHDSLFFWIEEAIKSKKINIKTYAEATEWIHDTVLIHIRTVSDAERLKK